MKGIGQTVLFLWLGSVAMAAASGPYVINSAGTRIQGASIVSMEDGTVVLTTASGQTLTFRPGAYRQAVAARPQEMGEIERLAREREFDAAARLLRQVKRQYRFLGWDIQASRMLARVELAGKRFAAAASEYEELFSTQPQLKAVAAERANYMQALLGSGRIREVSVLIDEEIASGSREAAARAQLVRGDLKKANGQVEEALLDYLRTALLFRDQQEVLPEAIYKTAVALKEMNDPRATSYFQQVLDEYPESEYAGVIKEEQKR